MFASTNIARIPLALRELRAIFGAGYHHSPSSCMLKCFRNFPTCHKGSALLIYLNCERLLQLTARSLDTLGNCFIMKLLRTAAASSFQTADGSHIGCGPYLGAARMSRKLARSQMGFLGSSSASRRPRQVAALTKHRSRDQTHMSSKGGFQQNSLWHARHGKDCLRCFNNRESFGFPTGHSCRWSSSRLQTRQLPLFEALLLTRLTSRWFASRSQCHQRSTLQALEAQSPRSTGRIAMSVLNVCASRHN
jgi:hypothetical protein